MTPKSANKVDPTDGRKPGDWQSRYPSQAWLQIVAELIYLLLILTATSVVLLSIGHQISITEGDIVQLCEWETSTVFLKWIAVALAGLVGGTTYDLKWLYHSVGRNTWNRDRLLWRIVVPLISSVVSVFFAFLVQAGFVNLTGAKPFGWYAALGLGFLFGYFSDNVIAYLYRTSSRLFGATEPSIGNDETSTM